MCLNTHAQASIGILPNELTFGQIIRRIFDLVEGIGADVPEAAEVSQQIWERLN